MFQSANTLEEFVKKTNSWGKLWGRKELSLDTAEGRQAIADIIDCELSPENLYCDGEIPRSVAERKRKSLTKLARELCRLDPQVKFYEFG